MKMRHAVMEDSEDLFRWRNDPVTQAAFKSTAPVSREAHNEWMWRHVRYGGADHIVLIGITDNGEKAGVVRFEARSDLEYEVSLTVAPEHRGHGCAAEILMMGVTGMPEFAINAEIRTENRASQNVFAVCGFRQVGSDKNFLKYRRGPRYD